MMEVSNELGLDSEVGFGLKYSFRLRIDFKTTDVFVIGLCDLRALSPR